MPTTLQSTSEAPPAGGPDRQVGRDWIAFGCALLLLGWLAGIHASNPASDYSSAVLRVGGVIAIIGIVLRLRRGRWLTAGGNLLAWVMWVFPRALLAGIALVLVAGSVSGPRQPMCPSEGEDPEAGALIRTQVVGERTVCVYEYTGTGGAL